MLITVGKLKQDHWVLKDESIELFHLKPGLFAKVKHYQSIQLKDIQNIQIYWKNVLMGRILKYAHPIYMNIITINNKNFTIELNTDDTRNNLIQAINYLKEHQISFDDKYHLLNAINDPQQNLWEYIEKIIKENDLGYK